MEEYIEKDDTKIIDIDEALVLDDEVVHAIYTEYINPSLAKMLGLLGLNKNFIGARGTKVWDREGNEYTDFLGAYGALNIGHNNEFVIREFNKIKTMPNLLQTYINPIASSLAKNLAAITPKGLKYSFFCNSGTEAVEGALKLAKISSGKSRIIYCEGSFHGKSMGALSVTGRDKYQKYFNPLVPLTHKIAYGNVEELQSFFKRYDDIAAFIVEPIQGEGGIIIPPKGYLSNIKRLCEEYGVLLILDEVQTGFGRTGHWFACNEENVSPDIMCMAKSLGGGIMPIGAYIASEEVWKKGYGSMEKALLHTSTFGGNTWAMAAGISTIQYIYNNSLDKQAKLKGQYFIHKLHALKREYPLLKEVRGKGLMIGLEFNSVGDNRFLKGLLKGKISELLAEYVGGLIATELLNEHKIITAYTLNNPNVIRIEPPLTISYEEIDLFIEALENILNTYRGIGGLTISNLKKSTQSILRR